MTVSAVIPKFVVGVVWWLELWCCDFLEKGVGACGMLWRYRPCPRRHRRHGHQVEGRAHGAPRKPSGLPPPGVGAPLISRGRSRHTRVSRPEVNTRSQERRRHCDLVSHRRSPNVAPSRTFGELRARGVVNGPGRALRRPLRRALPSRRTGPGHRCLVPPGAAGHGAWRDGLRG